MTALPGSDPGQLGVFSWRKGLFQDIPQGVTHKFHRHPSSPVKLHFKGQDDGHPVYHPGNGFDPAGAPGPDLGADIKKDGDFRRWAKRARRRLSSG